MTARWFRSRSATAGDGTVERTGADAGAAAGARVGSLRLLAGIGWVSPGKRPMGSPTSTLTTPLPKSVTCVALRSE